jgi:hypothetical protein
MDTRRRAGRVERLAARFPRLVIVDFIVLVGLLLTAAPGRAADEAPRVAHPWATRGDAFVLSGPGLFSSATAGSVGVSVQKTFFERWAWEETVAWGVGNRQVDGKDIGWTLAGTLRYAALMNAARSSAVTLGLGTALILGGGYGHMQFVYAELGYEYRSVGGFSALLAVGPDMVLEAPSGQGCEGAAGSGPCGRFRSGDFAAAGHLRAGLGWSF